VVVLLALLSALCNAAGAVLQRVAAGRAPPDTAMRLSLIAYLVHRRLWLLGMLALAASFGLQALALDQGALALVQPLLVLKLPLMAMLVIVAFPGRVRIGLRDWSTVVAMTGGLTLTLVIASPASSGQRPSTSAWLVAVAAGAVLLGAAGAAARRHPGPLRAALLGAASGIAFGYTAAFIKQLTVAFETSAANLPLSWPAYAVAGSGALAVLLQQGALQAGSLAASQSASLVVGTVSSVVLGVTLFQERTSVGDSWPLAVLGVALLGYSIVATTRSPLVTANVLGTSPDPDPGPQR